MGDTDPSAADDDRSTLSNSSFDASEEADAFYDRLSSYLADNSDDKDIQRECRRYNRNLSLVSVESDAHYSLAMVQNELNYISDDDLADLHGGEESIKAAGKWLAEVEKKVTFGSLSQDEENQSSNIASLIDEVGGDLVKALLSPSEDQLETLKRRKRDLSWRMKAVLCNFDNNKDIKLWFGQTNLAVVNFMHKYLLDSVGDQYSKARVVMAWNKLSKAQQTAIQNVIRLVDNCDKILQKEIEKIDKSEQTKKQKTTTTTTDSTAEPAVATASPEEEPTTRRTIEIPSTRVHGIEGVSNLASLTSTRKDRATYDSPKKASHLNSKQARAATGKVEDQFFKAANTIDPKHKPADEMWAERNSMIVSTDQTTSPPRNGYGNKKRNVITGDPNAVPTNVRLLVAHGGEEGAKKMFTHLLHTGMFDEEINKYVQGRDDSVFSNNSLEVVTSKEQLCDIRNKKSTERQRAEKQRSTEDVEKDKKIGATTTQSDDFASAS